jgi:hypothetical protein
MILHCPFQGRHARSVGLKRTHHLHVVFSTMNPPMSGPISGPINGLVKSISLHIVDDHFVTNLAVYTIIGADSSYTGISNQRIV